MVLANKKAQGGGGQKNPKNCKKKNNWSIPQDLYISCGNVFYISITTKNHKYLP